MRRTRRSRPEDHPYKTYMNWAVVTLAVLSGAFFAYLSYLLVTGVLSGASIRSLPPMLFIWTIFLLSSVGLAWESTRNYRLERRWRYAR